MFLTSALLLVAALIVMVLGALRGSTGLLGAALAMAATGAVCLGGALLVARRALVREGLVSPATDRSAAPAGGTASVLGSPPIVGYDDMAETQLTVLVSSGGLSRDQLALVMAYEAGHLGRRTVLDAVQAALRPEGATSAAG